MQIPASMTTSAAEEFLAKLDDEEEFGEIFIPTRGKHQAAGAEGAFVQALATWANGRANATLRTYAIGPDDVQIDRLVSRLYGISGCILADRVLAIKGEDLTKAVRKAALARLSELSKEMPYEASRGQQIEILCADHWGLSQPASLYSFDRNGVASVKELPAFRELVESVILRQVIGGGYRGAFPTVFVHALAVALYELIRNTDEHGQTDDRGDLRRKSLRGFHARKHALTPDSLIKITEDSPPLAEFCRTLMPARALNKQVQLVEISIFDTGPGLAASLTGRALSELAFDEELEAVRRCFDKHVTRKHSSSAGLGLPNLVDVLSRQGGFLRLRTGRCALYANLAREPVNQFGQQPQLHHWFGGDDPAPPVAGTLFTLLLPLKV